MKDGVIAFIEPVAKEGGHSEHRTNSDGGLVVQGDILYTNRRDDFIALAARYAIPAIYM